MSTQSFLISSLAYQVDKRHKFLERLISVKDEEVTSYENMNTCLITVTVCVCVFSILEVASYFTYLNYVSNVKILIITSECLFSFTHGSR